ncbi:MAG: stage III sporulation protein AE [Eubacteriales bacterium]|nr:stage III sporulation protein AE [Eubacteriales bacterium]
MKKLILIIIFLLGFSVTSYAEFDTTIREYPEYNEYVESIANGNNSLTPEKLLSSILSTLFGEISRSFSQLAAIITIAAAAGILRLMDTGSGYNEAAYFSVYTLMSVAVVKLLSEVAGYGSEVISSVCDFITKLAPIFLGLMAAAGKVSSATTFSPILSGAVYLLTLTVDKIILPMVYMSAILGIVGNISGRVQLGSFNRLLRSVSRWILTALLTVFTSLCALYGFNAPMLDALGAKSAKFAIGTLVPVVGGLLADTMETVVGGTHVLKNAVGSAGMICVIIIASTPIIKVWCIWFMLRLCAALAEPLCDKRMSVMLSDVSESLATLLAVMMTSVMLFLITIGIMLASTGTS